MKASIFYRVSSILLLLFAIGHTLAFSQIDPQWRVDATVHSMQTTHFNVNGSDCTYWDFYVGFGLFVTATLVFAAIVAWQLAGLPAQTLAALRIVEWGFVACFAAVAYLNWHYFFNVPIVFSTAILLCLTAGAWLSGR